MRTIHPAIGVIRLSRETTQAAAKMLESSTAKSREYVDLMIPNKRGWIKTENGWEPQGDREKQIVFQIQAGRPTKDIAGQFDVSAAYISRVRRRIGAPDLRRTPKRAAASAGRS